MNRNRSRPVTCAQLTRCNTIYGLVRRHSLLRHFMDRDTMALRSSWRTMILSGGLLALIGCNALNPVCQSARPSPVLTSIDPTSVSYSDVQKTFTLNIVGSRFVASSVAVIDTVQLATVVTSSTTMTATVGPTDIKSLGTVQVWVFTPAGNTGDLGCSSGGNSSKTSLTVK